MGAPRKNQFWKLRSKHGREKLFASPELLWEAACEYFEWCDKNPLKEAKAFAYQGKISRTTLSKMRAYTLNGLCLYLNCSESYFRSFKSTAKTRKNEEFLEMIEKIETVIYEQKFTGAAADLLNANIISRDLGLRDNHDLTTAGESMNLSPGERRKRIAEILEKARKMELTQKSKTDDNRE